MRNKKILLVEDIPDDAELTIRALKKANLLNDIVHVQDGVEALEYLFGTGKWTGRDVNDIPEVVLLDLKLPKVDGLEVLRRVRSDERTKILPVVVLTSSDEEQDLVESYRLGANSYVRKPVDIAKFTQAIGQLGIYWLILNEPVPAGICSR